MSIDSWKNQVQDKVEHAVDIYSEMVRWERRSIYRLPASIINLNRNAYTPQVVSFGPYHHGRPNLEPMEEHKERALIHFLRRSNKPIDAYLQVLVGAVDRLRDAYQPLDNHWREDRDRFLKLMILDGCFMLEILRIFTRSMQGYAENDPIFSNHGIVYVMPDIVRDMLMIENQLPMLVLYALVDVEDANRTEPAGSVEQLKPEEYVNRLLFSLYNLHSYIRGKSMGRFLYIFKSYISIEVSKSLHVLDICHKVLVLPPDASHRTRKKWPTWVLEKTIPSATELHEAGIQIQRSRSRGLQNIRFYRGVFCFILKLPIIVVDNVTETFFLNLLAFERLHVGAGREVTNYLAFMNNIIRDSKDISLLRSCGIIQNSLGKDEVVADLFNSLTKDITIDPDSSVYMVEKVVIKYCNRPWVRWRANLVRTYFSNPWASISVIASMFLFAFTLAQTGYTIIAYYRRR